MTEVKGLESRLHALALDVGALDAIIRLSAPELDVEAVRVRPIPRRGGAKPGDNARIVLDLLRAEGPKTSRELIEAVMERREMSRADRRFYTVMRNRVMSSLQGSEKRARLGRYAEGRWVLATTSTVSY